MKVVNTENKPIKMWLDDIEDGALEQAKNVANLPFAFRHVAIMPDSHQGYGMPIGCVLAAENVVIPNAVGVDVGCGMQACRTSLMEIDSEIIKKILGGSKENKGGIRSCIPLGGNHHSKKQHEEYMPDIFSISPDVFEAKYGEPSISYGLYESARKQIGTLGGGNHFLEIQKGSDGFIWIMIHSGSRNLGYQVANYYNKLATELNEKWFSSVPKSHQLAFFSIDTKEGQMYIEEMIYCKEFAKKNRDLMMKRIQYWFSEFTDAEFSLGIDASHNYARMENHFGKNVMVHRKGATSAREGELGIIPGSQGSKSYIVKGKGNKESFMSCSHGAGRKMSRTRAQNELSIEDQKKILDDIGVIHGIRNAKDLDEAPGAYKDISEVMKNQKDLVKIEVELTPLAVIKG